jgi:predicted O-methyltransferase YrrM
MSDSHPIPDINPLPLWNLAHVYCEAKTFHSAVDLGIFTILEGKQLTSEQIAEALALQVRPVRMILDACVGLELLEKVEGTYKNTPLSSAFLVRGKPNYSGNFVTLEAYSYQAWANLTQAIRQNGPVVLPMKDDSALKFFTHAMYSTSVFSSSILAEVVDLSGYKSLLDVGGGSGINAIRFAERYPDLQATVFDQPAALEVAREYIAASPAKKRITTAAGNYLEKLPHGYDAALLSNILHGESPEQNHLLLKRVFHVLDSPGLVIISDTLPNEERTGPLFPLLFALNELLHTEGGDTYTETEIKGWLEAAGFRNVNTIRFDPAPLALITAKK